MLRMCMHTHHTCNCNDAEVQPCLAALIADYLDSLWWRLKTDGIDGGPGDDSSVWYAHKGIAITSHSFDSLEDLRRHLNRWGVGMYDPAACKVLPPVPFICALCGQDPCGCDGDPLEI